MRFPSTLGHLLWDGHWVYRVEQELALPCTEATKTGHIGLGPGRLWEPRGDPQPSPQGREGFWRWLWNVTFLDGKIGKGIPVPREQHDQMPCELPGTFRE